MKVSLISTILNEEKSIVCLLESIAKQTRLPDEVVFVDGGSTDRTLDLIKQFRQQVDFPIRIIKKASNRSEARNLAIQKAKHGIIAVTDAGCMLGSHWLERITKPLVQQKAESVAGFYLTLTPTYLSQAIAPYVAVLAETFDATSYLPSSRSVAFTKSAWRKAGKYPEHLNYCEDLIFAQNLKEKTVMTVVPKAIVYWTQKSTFPEFFKQIKNYAKGDVQAGYMPHIKKILSVYARYGAFALFPPIFLLYILWPVYKHRKTVNSPLNFIHLPPLQITADLAIMTGGLVGFWSVMQSRPRKVG